MELEERLHQPLYLLKDVCARLLNREIPFSASRLEGLYAHIAAAVGEVLDFAGEELQRGFDELETAARQAENDAPGSPFADSMARFMDDYAHARAEIETGLEEARESFFSAASFADLEGQLGFLELAEGRIEAGLQRLEATLMQAEDPELWTLPGVTTAPELPAALEALSDALQAVTLHMEDGSRAPLADALSSLDKARGILALALSSLP